MSFVFCLWHMVSFRNVFWYSCQYFKFVNTAKWFNLVMQKLSRKRKSKLKGTDQNFEIHSKWQKLRKKMMENRATIQCLPKAVEKKIEIRLKLLQKNFEEKLGSFGMLFAPQLQSTCHYKVNHYVKILRVRLGGANNMRPPRWGGGTNGKDPKID